MLIPCYECQKSISSHAVACPSCGAKIAGRVCSLCGGTSVKVGFDFKYSTIIYEFTQCESCGKAVVFDQHPNPNL